MFLYNHKKGPSERIAHFYGQLTNDTLMLTYYDHIKEALPSFLP